MNWLSILVMLLGILLIPVGLPGLWLMIAVVLYNYLVHEVGMMILVLCVLIAVVAELIEFLIVKRATARYGGTRKAFWGAMAGGLIGVIVGVPIPVIGSVVAGLIGSFVGAAIVTFAETREMLAAHRVGWGVVVGRLISTATKTAAGVTIFVLATAALVR